MLIDELQKEVYEWSSKNFGTGPHRVLQDAMGVVEEVGELFHAMLKMEQGIRGTKEEHIAKAKDAVGDTVIYLVDLWANAGYGDLSEEINHRWAGSKDSDDLVDLQKYLNNKQYLKNPHKSLDSLLSATSSLYNSVVENECPRVGDVFYFLASFCNAMGWRLQEIVETTWAEVSKRDWKKDPTNGKSV